MLNDDALVRYARHISLKEIGEEGQAKLARSRVLVVGAGGLGSPLLLYLAASGVGHIGIVDHDRVALSNLQRQIIHETVDIDRSKAESAADAIEDLNPEVKVDYFAEKLDERNAERFVADYDIVADGSDNPSSRFLVHDTCFKLKKPLVSASVIGFEGQLAVFKGYEGEDFPCYRCLYPEQPDDSLMPTCAESGIFSPAAGVIGSMQASEVIKQALSMETSLEKSLLRFNLLQNSIRSVKLRKDPACLLCKA